MTSKLRERHSRLAVWSVRLALLSLPILIIAAVGHRTGRLDAVPTYGAMALGFGLALLAVIAALIAFEAIWRDGRCVKERPCRTRKGASFASGSPADFRPSVPCSRSSG